MTHPTRLLSALALAALTGACTWVHTTPLAATSYPEVPADSVRLFATNPPAKYVEIAMMRVEGIIATDKRSAKALREKAGKMGANGVILLNPRAAVVGGGSGVGVIVGGKNPSVVVGGDEQEVDEFERAVAIRYDASATDSTRVGARP
ncbi:MAG TPA: hypothetical protein VHM67_09075 [Gemmatimonadaceae bacterium]|nr:hypothetical protein [Gemmatimonadaceae bacterium]